MMDEYLKAAEEFRKLRDEYEIEAKKLDPLRWRMIKAQNRAEAAWQRVRDNALEQTIA